MRPESGLRDLVTRKHHTRDQPPHREKALDGEWPRRLEETPAVVIGELEVRVQGFHGLGFRLNAHLFEGSRFLLNPQT